MYTTKDFFDMEHYHKVYAARKEQGLSVARHAIEITYPLVGKKFLRNSTGEICNVESAHLHWYMGWYVVLMVENNRSHAAVVWENISSLYDKIDAWCARSHNRYSLVE